MVFSSIDKENIKYHFFQNKAVIIASICYASTECVVVVYLLKWWINYIKLPPVSLHGSLNMLDVLPVYDQKLKITQMQDLTITMSLPSNKSLMCKQGTM